MQKLNLKFLFFTITILFLCAGQGLAQQDISAEKQALIREFLEVMGGQKSANEMMDMMITFQEKESPKMISSLIEQDDNLTSAQKQELQQMTAESAKRVSKRIREFLTERLNIGQMIEEISFPIYDKNYTESELRDIIAFYRTPTGQKTIALAPQLMMEAMMAFSEKFTPKFQEFIKETTEAELVHLTQKLQNGSGKKTGRKS